MKQILIILTMVMALCSVALAQTKTTLQADSIANGKAKTTVNKAKANKAENADSVYNPSYTDTSDSGETVESESVDVTDSDAYDEYDYGNNANIDFLEGMVDNSTKLAGTIAIVAILAIFGLPLLIVFAAFYFSYRNRKQRYRLVEKAIEAGQPIPEGMFKESIGSDMRSKGIKNTCLGVGLFIFLWGITDSFGIGCIGLLVMFTGIGQWLTSRRNEPPTDEKK